MPKHFPSVPNVHPEVVDYPPQATSTGDPLADLLFDGADQATIAQHLRDARDEWSSHPLAELLCLCVTSLPLFRRAEVDGHDAQVRVFENEDKIRSLERLRPDSVSAIGLDAHQKLLDAANDERRRLDELSACEIHATCGLQAINRFAPALLRDLRSVSIGGVINSDEILDRRLRISNFHVDHKLSLSVDHDGWPRCENRRSESHGTVRLVTIAQKGIRI